MAFPKSQSILSLYHLKTLGCPPQFLDTSYSLTRLRLNFEKKTDASDNFEMRVLGRVLERNLTRNMMKSLALFLRQRGSRFPEIIRVVAVSHIYTGIQHLEIHQFVPTQVRHL